GFLFPLIAEVFLICWRLLSRAVPFEKQNVAFFINLLSLCGREGHILFLDKKYGKNQGLGLFSLKTRIIVAAKKTRSTSSDSFWPGFTGSIRVFLTQDPFRPKR